MGQPRILAIDDEQLSRELVKLVLTHRGYTVSLAQSGPLGLNMAWAERPAAIILDIGMPQMNGYDVYRHLRNDPRTAGIPVLFLTVRSPLYETQLQAILDTASPDSVGYLGKPFTNKDLIGWVEHVLPAPAAA